ncbi:hypothetical protein Bca4012_039513 [Brassica carinata]
MAKSKRSSNIGNGVITPTQIAFIVDRYLHDNRFSKTRSLFRSEASSLLSNSPVRDVLKSYLTLKDILKDYVSLREQKVDLDHEKVILEKEKVRVQNLLQGMQNVMNTYNSNLTAPPPPAPVVAPDSHQKPHNISSEAPPPVARKARIGTAQANSAANETNWIPQAVKTAKGPASQTLSLDKNSSVNKSMTGDGSRLTDSSLPTNSTCLMTPQKHASSVTGKSNSPQKEVTPTNCTIVTKERFTISPLKQITSYTMERSHLISSSSPVKSNLQMSSKRDHVKGRLNFDDTDTDMCLEAAPITADLASSSPSGSEPEVDLSDIDFSILAEDFSFSELLVDFDIGFEGSTHITPLETVSGYVVSGIREWGSIG